MGSPLRILLTGFGPFPGAPFNPTMPLVDRLTRLRRPALSEVERISHIFPVTYQAVDQQLPALLARHRPHALLMFGLASRTGYIRVETRARNAITALWPDASQNRPRLQSIVAGSQAQAFGPHTALLFRAASETGLDVRLSRDAGSYLCNYLSWRAIEAARAGHSSRVAAFIHVPAVARGCAPYSAAPMTLTQLVAVGEALLLTTVKLARQAAMTVD